MWRPLLFRKFLKSTPAPADNPGTMMQPCLIHQTRPRPDVCHDCARQWPKRPPISMSDTQGEIQIVFLPNTLRGGDKVVLRYVEKK